LSISDSGGIRSVLERFVKISRQIRTLQLSLHQHIVPNLNSMTPDSLHRPYQGAFANQYDCTIPLGTNPESCPISDSGVLRSPLNPNLNHLLQNRHCALVLNH
jgi:hypothetical protein